MRSGFDHDVLTHDTLQSDASPTDMSPADDALGLGMGLDLFGEPSSAKPVSPQKPLQKIGTDARFARAVLREWINHLRGVPENTRITAYFGFERKLLEQITDELITAVDRFDLESQLLEKVSQTEQVGTKRERLVDRQVLAVKAVLGDFLAWLGFDRQCGSYFVASRVNPGQPLFARPDRIPSGQWPPIDSTAVDYTKVYLADWLVALATLIVGNAGHDAGREISAEMNAQLGGILRSMKAARLESM
jgi:hypothetical protein